MAQLVIDEGNTLIKAAVFDDNQLIWSAQYTIVDINEVNQVITQHNVSKAIISSVRNSTDNWLTHLSHISIVPFNRNMATGIRNHYCTPGTLGLDRLAAVIGARHLHPNQNNLVIDAGTCITYDSVDRDGNYFGGSISPGLNMRYQALNHYTAALPLVTVNTDFEQAYGDDTMSAIHSGVQNGVRYEIEGFIRQYTGGAENPNVILTGGDSVYLHSALKNSIFAGSIKTEPHLVLTGLNAALTQHND